MNGLLQVAKGNDERDDEKGIEPGLEPMQFMASTCMELCFSLCQPCLVNASGQNVKGASTASTSRSVAGDQGPIHHRVFFMFLFLFSCLQIALRPF